MKQRVLITGASGFVGYHIIEQALQNNLDVYAAIRKGSNIEHLKHLNIQYIYLNYTDISSLKNQLQANQYHYIIHAAGVTRARSQNEYDTINAGYTHNLALAALDSGINLKKLVLISSLAALGPLNTLTGIITEHTAPAPLTAYGKSKLLAEENLKAISALNFTILRPTGVYGPRDRDIFIFFKHLVNGIEPYIGNLQQKLSLIYVTDLAQAAIKALYAGDKKTYNLCDGNFYNRYELGNITKEVLNLKTLKLHLPINMVKAIAALSEKWCYLNHKASVLNTEKLKELMAVNWHCDIEQAKAELGFYPQYNLQAGVTETLKWYKANKWL